MRAKAVVVVSLVTIAFLAGCLPAPAPTPPPSPPPLPDDQAALNTLLDFVTFLHDKQYGPAANLYGGSYETMMDHNPAVDPARREILLRNACELNGAQCLIVRTTNLKEQVSPSEFVFTLEFQTDDGAAFILGPCCGATEAEMPSQSHFDFRVVKQPDGRFLVLDMPPYAP